MTGVLDLNQYMIKEKFWKIFGNKFWFEDVNEKRYGFCEQKRFKLKEDIRIYVDESKSQEWLKIKQKQIVDAWGGYDIMDSQTGEHIGTVRRKFWASVLRTRWHLLDAAGNEVGMLIEDRWDMPWSGAFFLEDCYQRNFILKSVEGANL